VSSPVLVDAGPLVALLDGSDRHRAWAVARFKELPGPLLTCEAVLAEAFYLLRRLRPAQEKLLEWIASCALKIPLSIEEESEAIRSLWARYENVPMSLADACLVRLAELHPLARVFTLDSDFTIYRVRGKQAIPLIWPGS
jgi:predicted nucleic acid-binding protein